MEPTMSTWRLIFSFGTALSLALRMPSLGAETENEAMTAASAERIEAVVNLVLKGGDVSGVFFGQMHQDESPIPLIFAVSRRLLARLDRMNDSQRQFALAFLCDQSLGPLKSCTVFDIEKRLGDLEERQRKLERSKPASPTR